MPPDHDIKKTVYVTLTGLPLTFDLRWPFRLSTSGADFWVLHAAIRLAISPELHAPVAVNLTQVGREVVPSLEPEAVQAPVINALRKEVDRRQLEFLKSGKLVPVQFSSRHYNFKDKHWIFGKASDEVIKTLILRKVYWQTKAFAGDVWLGDETEAQYVESTTDRLIELATELAKQGFFRLERRYATALPALSDQASSFETDMRAALEELEKKHAFERG